MSNNLPPMLLNDVEDQLKEIFTGNELITLTNDFANSVGEKVTFQAVGYNSKKDILSKNISDLSDKSKREFFEQLKSLRKVASDETLVSQINKLITGGSPSVNSARSSISFLLSQYSSKINRTWVDSVRFYDSKDYRNSLDSIRLTLELLLKELLNNNKSLENQKQALGVFLKENGISPQFTNLLLKELNMYEKIQNNEVKHDVPEHLSKPEITFLMNQAAIIIKFLDNCNNGES